MYSLTGWLYFLHVMYMPLAYRRALTARLGAQKFLRRILLPAAIDCKLLYAGVGLGPESVEECLQKP